MIQRHKENGFAFKAGLNCGELRLENFAGLADIRVEHQPQSLWLSRTCGRSKVYTTKGQRESENRQYFFIGNS